MDPRNQIVADGRKAADRCPQPTVDQLTRLGQLLRNTDVRKAAA